MKNVGVVKEVNGNELTILAYKKAGCGSCKKCSEGGKYSGEYKFRVKEEYTVGDEIEFDIPSNKALGIGALVYIFPLLGMFTGYIIGNIIFDNELFKIVCTFLGLFISFVIIYLFDKIIGKKFLMNINIKKR